MSATAQTNAATSEHDDEDGTDSVYVHLVAALAETPCDHALTHTRRWAVDHGVPEAIIVDLLERHGGFCDCEVVTNAWARLVGG